MSELEYASLSFKCKEIAKNLEDGKRDKIRSVSNKAEHILNICLRIESSDKMLRSFSDDVDLTPGLISPLIFKTFDNKSNNQIIRQLKKLIEYLESFDKNGKLSKTHREKLIFFFKKLSQISYNQSQHIVRLKDIGNQNYGYTFGFSFNQARVI